MATEVYYHVLKFREMENSSNPDFNPVDFSVTSMCIARRSETLIPWSVFGYIAG